MYHYKSKDVFQQIENIQKLLRLKKDIDVKSIAREEQGLQIIDVSLHFPFFIAIPSRLKYTTVPERYSELKQIKGLLKEYSYRYTIENAESVSVVTIETTIRFPLYLFGPLLSFLFSPFIKHRVSVELKILDKLLVQAE